MVCETLSWSVTETFSSQNLEIQGNFFLLVFFHPVMFDKDLIFVACSASGLIELKLLTVFKER